MFGIKHTYTPVRIACRFIPAWRWFFDVKNKQITYSFLVPSIKYCTSGITIFGHFFYKREEIPCE